MKFPIALQVLSSILAKRIVYLFLIREEGAAMVPYSVSDG